MADALSRRDLEASEGTVEKEEFNGLVTLVTPTWLKEVTGSYMGDDSLSSLVQSLLLAPEGKSPYTLNNGIVKYKGRLVIGDSVGLKRKLFRECHGSTP